MSVRFGFGVSRGDEGSTALYIFFSHEAQTRNRSKLSKLSKLERLGTEDE